MSDGTDGCETVVARSVPRDNANISSGEDANDDISNSGEQADKRLNPSSNNERSGSPYWTEDSLQAKVDKAIKDDDVSRLENLLPSEYLEKTFTFGFHTPHPAVEIHPTAESWTALLWASAVGSTQIVVNLLDRGANVLSQKRWEGSTVFHIAALCGHSEILELLFSREPELLGLRTIDGETALILAARQGCVAALETLLAMGADPTVANLIAQTALHAVCTNGDANGCQALLTSLLQRSPSEAKAAITATDMFGASPFDQAVQSSHTKIILQLLETPAYFPSFPFRDQVILPTQVSPPSHVEELLLKWMHSAPEEDLSRHQEAVACWAWLNGRERLIDMNHKASLNREEAHWIHIAAIGGHTPVMKRCLGSKTDVITPARGGITPLHLAATHGRLDLLQYLLTYLSELGSESETRGVDALDAILMATEENRTVLDCAILGRARKHRRIEGFLWRYVHQFINQQDGFFCSQPSKATRVLELAARHSFPGKEKNLHKYFQMMPLRSGLPPIPDLGLEYDRNALHWAIYHQQAKVVWWLLANREHTRDGNMLRGIDLNARVGNALTTADEQGLNRLIGELLLNPPPLIKHSMPNGDDLVPPFIYVTEVYIHEQAMVTDFHAREPHFCFRTCQMYDLIYGIGASEIMSDDCVQTMASLKAALQPLKVDQSNSDIIQGLPIPSLLRGAERKRHRQLRWFHLPYNELELVQDLMTRIARDQGLTAKDHRPSDSFVKESCVTIPAGGGKSYAKPQCLGNCRDQHKHQPSARSGQTRAKLMRESPQEKADDKSIVSFYMPYLSWSQWPPKPADATSNHQTQTQQSAFRHETMTLDQYYYVSLDDTSERDVDQVMARYIQRQEARRATAALALFEEATIKPHEEVLSQILVVDQLWLWILGDDTVITCTPQNSGSAAQGILDLVMEKLQSPSNNWRVSGETLAEVIASTAVGLFNEKQISVPGTKVSPLEVFRAAIGFVRSSEAELFKNFQTSFKKREAELNKSQSSEVGDGKENEYLNIGAEMSLLVEIKDICDELNILKSLVEDQERVWRQASDVIGNGNGMSTFRDCLPSEVKRDIIGMIQDAEVIQKSIYTLVDLKQKQASPTEAMFARQQAQDTAKQTDTIVVFTVVTIVFLPLSFLTSLFALNISNFPHEGDEVVYQGSWIFPILFGVSVAVSGFFMTIAFQANSLKMHLSNGWRHLKSEAKKRATRGSTKSPTEDEKV
ncbi:hypothetical protein BJY00DRAFT_313252 [Aspergillus carlsbadensis]|nr:hypothetical protein BJY00DRAFT_313252 [Aspergillus carlsbadensis]